MIETERVLQFKMAKLLGRMSVNYTSCIGITIASAERRLYSYRDMFMLILHVVRCF